MHLYFYEDGACAMFARSLTAQERDDENLPILAYVDYTSNLTDKDEIPAQMLFGICELDAMQRDMAPLLERLLSAAFFAGRESVEKK